MLRNGRRHLSPLSNLEFQHPLNLPLMPCANVAIEVKEDDPLIGDHHPGTVDPLAAGNHLLLVAVNDPHQLDAAGRNSRKDGIIVATTVDHLLIAALSARSLMI